MEGEKAVMFIGIRAHNRESNPTLVPSMCLAYHDLFLFFFFFQAEDGIRDLTVTGVQTCALPIYRDRVAAFYGAVYRPNVARILVTGDVTLAEARRLLTARFGGWERGPVAALPEAAAPPPAARTGYLVDKPGAAQAVIRIGHVGGRESTRL